MNVDAKLMKIIKKMKTLKTFEFSKIVNAYKNGKNRWLRHEVPARLFSNEQSE
tara:strand:- start:1541 stop:1699 length:159 start_codon:yes stop_codon:yes gene_type:complete